MSVTDDSRLGVRDAARILGVHENTIRNMIRDGRLTVAARITRSGYARFDPAEVEQARKLMEGDPGWPVRARMLSMERLVHLTQDWDAMAAQIERDVMTGTWIGQDARTLRWCARQLRDLTETQTDTTAQ